MTAPVKCRGCGDVRATSCGTADCPVPLQMSGDLDAPNVGSWFEEFEKASRVQLRRAVILGAISPPEVSRERLIAEAALRWRDAKCAGAPECSAYEEDHGDKCPFTIATMALREALEGWTP